MKLKIVTIIFLSISLQLIGQEFDPTVLAEKRQQQIRAKEKLKLERMYIHSVDEKDIISEKGTLRSEVAFNEFGKIIKHSGFFPNMTIINETQYDSKGNEIKMISKNGEGKIRQTLIYEYDSKNVLSKVKYYGPSGKLTSTKNVNEKFKGDYKITYNPKGEITSKTYSKFDSLEKTYVSRLLTPKNEMNYENKYWFDDKMQIVKWTIIDNIQNLKSKRTYTYDDRGNEIEELMYEMDDKLTSKVISKYNDKNLIIESYWYEGRLKEVYKYEYEY